VAPHRFFRSEAGDDLIRLALNLNKLLGGGLAPWLFAMQPSSLLELNRHMMAWLEEHAPDDT
jgi:hypothetical protein